MKLEETKAYKEYAENRKERMKTIKRGGNVVHLSYYKGPINEDDISDFKNVIEKTELEFSSYNKNGDMFASLDNYTLSVFVIISQITIQEILNGTITNATWDAIKYVVGKTWSKVRKKTITKYTSSTSNKEEVKFGIKVSLDENTHFDFYLNGNLNEETIIKSLDKTFEFIAKQQMNKGYKFPYYVEYDENVQEWKSIDVDNLLRNINVKPKKKKKKKK